MRYYKREKDGERLTKSKRERLTKSKRKRD